MRSLRRSFLLPLLWLPFSAFAAGEQWFDIPAQSLSEALKLFASQAKMQLLYEPDAISSALSNQLLGEYDEHAALESLLKGTGFEVVFTKANGATIRPVLNGVRASTSSLDSSDASSLRLAQTQEANDQSQTGSPVSAGTDKSDTKLEEIIVTATKREEPLQDIPMSVSVLNEQQLIKQGAVGLIDYATRVPNLSFGATSDNALGANSVAIRGVVGGGGSLGGGTTGFYIDDVPVPEFMNPKVIDISRIEVLRGPQGSLYGARSMGGTVRLITKRADPNAREFNVHATLSDVAEGGQDYAADAAFNIPISENAAFRGSAYHLSETGVHDMRIDNPFVSGDEITLKNADDGEYWGLQAMVTWNVTENFTVEPRFIYQNSHIDWLQWSDGSPDNFTNTRWSRLADPNDLEWSISSLTLTWDRDWGRFTSASGYFEHDSDSREEYSIGANFLQTEIGGVFLTNFGIGNGGDPTYYPPGGVLITRNQFTKQVTEEMRFTSEFDGRLQMTAGVFYSESKTDSNVPCTYTVGFNDAGNFPFGTDCLIASHFIQETDELAFFGEFEFAISRNLLLTAGGRYYDNSFDIANTRSGWIEDFGAPSGPTRYGSQKEEGFNPKVAVKLEATDDWTVYASAAKGFRIGGANVTGAPPSCDDDLAAIGISGSPDTFDSDSLWNYEVGSKSTHLDDRLSVNAAAFFIDWQDMIQGTNLACGFGFTNNTGKAEIKGFELEVAARPVDRLTFNLGVGYADGKVTDPEAAAGVLKGDPIPQVPQWTFSGDMEYRFPVNAREGYFFLGYRWVDESVSVNAGRGTPRIRDAYDLLDARLGMTFGNMDVSLFGKNLTNEHANLSDNVQLALEAPGYRRYVVNRPRTIGIDMRWAF